MFLPHPRVKVSIAGSLRDREVASSASDRQGSNFESCVWRTVSSQSSHHPQEVLLAQFSLYVHKGGLKPDSFLSTRCCSLGRHSRPILGLAFITPSIPSNHHPQPSTNKSLDPQPPRPTTPSTHNKIFFIPLDGNQIAGKVASHSPKMETKCQTVTNYVYFK